MIITYKKGTQLNGKNPTILYGYGGFNISQTPGFRSTNALWLEQGGVYAVPNIRGGGEYGRDWHNAGIQTKKQNVFEFKKRELHIHRRAAMGENARRLKSYS